MKTKIAPTRAEALGAIKNQQLRLYYQPLYASECRRFTSVEALVRWEHPVHGLLAPFDFLLAMKKLGLETKLGDWVLKTACHQLYEWKMAGLKLDRIAVNVTSRQLCQKDFVDCLMTLLDDSGVKPHELELELTEESLIHDRDQQLLHLIHRLRNLGVHVTLDDFGTGYSSISNLRHIPIDRIKIDKTYIKNMLKNPTDAIIVQAMITLARGLSLRIVAEGVESYPQLVLLLMHEGLELQGYYFSKPLSPEKAKEFLIYYQNHPFPLTE